MDVYSQEELGEGWEALPIQYKWGKQVTQLDTVALGAGNGKMRVPGSEFMLKSACVIESKFSGVGQKIPGDFLKALVDSDSQLKR